MCRHGVNALTGEEFSFLFFCLFGGNPRRRHRSPLLCSPFCRVACLWLPESMELPSYILKGLLRNPPACSFFIHSALLSLFTSKCQPLSPPRSPSPTPHFPPPTSASVCSRLKKCFCIPLFIFTSITPAYSDVPPPPLHSPLPHTTFLSHKPFLCLFFWRFCFAD